MSKLKQLITVKALILAESNQRCKAKNKALLLSKKLIDKPYYPQIETRIQRLIVVTQKRYDMTCNELIKINIALEKQSIQHESELRADIKNGTAQKLLSQANNLVARLRGYHCLNMFCDGNARTERVLNKAIFRAARRAKKRCGVQPTLFSSLNSNPAKLRLIANRTAAIALLIVTTFKQITGANHE
jgi:hypothetical protein